MPSITIVIYPLLSGTAPSSNQRGWILHLSHLYSHLAAWLVDLWRSSMGTRWNPDHLRSDSWMIWHLPFTPSCQNRSICRWPVTSRSILSQHRMNLNCQVMFVHELGMKGTKMDKILRSDVMNQLWVETFLENPRKCLETVCRLEPDHWAF